MKALRAVLVGLGNMGRHHFRILSEESRFDLIAVVDPLVQAEAVAPIPVYRSLQEALQIPSDVVFIAAPTEIHVPLVEEALEASRHVFVEKPAAPTLVQARGLVHLAERKARKLAVGNIERCNPVVRALRQLVEAKVFGPLISLAGTRAGAYPRTVKAGNDVILDLAVHELDVFRTLLGPLQVISCVAHAVQAAGIYDSAQILLRSTQGVSGTISVDWFSPQRVRTIRLTGRDASAELDYLQQSLEISGHQLKARLAERFPEWQWHPSLGEVDRALIPVEKKESLKIQCEEFFAYLQDQPHRLAVGEELLESVALIEDAGRKAQQLSSISAVTLTDDLSPQFR